MALADEKYMLLTTYRRDGTPVPTPVWVTGMPDGKVAFYTSSGSGKAKRLAHTARVTVQPCDARGRVRPGTEPIEATAEVVSGPRRDAVYEQVVAKYGFMTKIARFVGNVGGVLRRKRVPYADRAVIVTPTG